MAMRKCRSSSSSQSHYSWLATTTTTFEKRKAKMPIVRMTCNEWLDPYESPNNKWLASWCATQAWRVVAHVVVGIRRSISLLCVSWLLLFCCWCVVWFVLVDWAIQSRRRGCDLWCHFFFLPFRGYVIDSEKRENACCWCCRHRGLLDGCCFSGRIGALCSLFILWLRRLAFRWLWCTFSIGLFKNS